MASYISGLTDVIPQVQQFTPDYNFLGNILQTKQGQYDSANARLGDVYGSILYSPLSREDNMTKRDDFFKAIDQDIKKMAGMDLSLSQNEAAAMKIFNGFYDDKAIVKDMMWTKNYERQQIKRDNLKACIDPDKCGGSAWEGGDKEMQYKLDEFRKVSQDQSLNFQDVEYTPHINVEDKAVKLAKEMGFNMKVDTVKGGWIVTDKNGQMMQPSLADFFLHKFGNDPAVRKMYKTQAYVNRKDWVSANIMNYQDENSANMDYVAKMLAVNQPSRETEAKAEEAVNFAKSKKSLLDEQLKNKGYYEEVDGPFRKAYEANEQDIEVLQGVQQNKKEYNDLAVSTANNLLNPNISFDRIDELVALNLLKGATDNAATHYSTLTMERLVKEDPFALSTHTHNLSLRNELKKMEVDMQNYRTKKEIDFEFDSKLKILEGKLAGGVTLDNLDPNNQGTVLNNGDQLRRVSGVGGTGTGVVVDPKEENYKMLKNLTTQSDGMKSKYLTDYVKTIVNGYGNAKSDAQKQFYREALTKTFAGTGVSADAFLNPNLPGAERLTNINLLDAKGLSNAFKVAKDYADPNGAGLAAKDFFSGEFSTTHAIDALTVDMQEQHIKAWDDQLKVIGTSVANKVQGKYISTGETKKAAMLAEYMKHVHRPLSGAETSAGAKSINGPMLKLGEDYVKNNWQKYLDEAAAMNYEKPSSLSSRERNIQVPGLPKQKVVQNTAQLEKIAKNLATADYRKNMYTVLDDYDKSYKKKALLYSSTKAIPGEVGNANTADAYGGTIDVNNRGVQTTAGMDWFKSYRDNQNDPTVKVTFGDGSQVIKESDEDAQAAMNVFIADMQVPYKQGDDKRPRFNWFAQKVSGGDANTVSMTFKPDDLYLQKFVGSSEKPGPLAGMVDKFKNGITMAFPKGMVNNQYMALMQENSYDYLYESSGKLAINIFPDVKAVLEKVNGKDYYTLTANVIDEKGKVREMKMTNEVAPSSFNAAGEIRAAYFVSGIFPDMQTFQNTINADKDQARKVLGTKGFK